MSDPIQLVLADWDASVHEALLETFAGQSYVRVVLGDIFSLGLEGIILSPGNSYGFMDGGFDRHLLDLLGTTFESDLRSQISQRPEGFLPVGSALPVRSGHRQFPFVVYAPTMNMPEATDAMSVERAFAAALRALSSNFPEAETAISPGFGSGVGQLAPRATAAAMFAALDRWQSRVGENSSKNGQEPTGSRLHTVRLPHAWLHRPVRRRPLGNSAKVDLVIE